MTAETRMKIVFVVGSFQRGGAEGQLCRLAVELHERGHEVTVVAMSDGGPLAGTLDAAGVGHLVFGRQGSSRLLIVRVAGMVRATFRLGRLMKRERPDVCHAWMWGAYVVAIPVALICGVPVRLAALRGMLQPRERTIIRRALTFPAMSLAHGVTSNSNAAADDARAQRLVPRRTSIRVIHNGIDLPVRVADASHDPPAVVCVANLIAYKGHRTAIDAWAMIDKPPTLSFVGDGLEGERLQAQAAGVGVSNVINFLGTIPDPSAVVRSSQIAMLPSLTESFPNAVLEAMAAALPVVATKVGGVTELVDESCGILVPAGDPKELACAVERLVADPELRSRLGRAGRSKALQFSWTQCVRTHEDYYRELLRG